MSWSSYLARKFFLLREASRQKTIVFIVSTMRSGSTLLKSLLATAPDISHLPETDFSKYHGKRSWRLKTLSADPIIVVKKPAPFANDNYPALPQLARTKTIVLVRDAYESVRSLKKMVDQVYPDLSEQWTYQELLNNYWLPVTSSLLDKAGQAGPDWLLVRYEDLIQTPIPITEKLFRFIGSQQRDGVDRYTPPSSYEWAWGNDDGGDKIKSFRVQYEPPVRADEQLLQLITSSPAVATLRERLGYTDLE